MEESLFGDLPLEQPDPTRGRAHQKRCCLGCSNFAGRERDRTGYLFRLGKGYCNSDDWHPCGRYAVVQNIIHEKQCKAFKPTDAKIVEMRKKAAIRYGLMNDDSK